MMLGLFLILPVGSHFAFTPQVPSNAAGKAQSRLGVKGEMGYVVVRSAPGLEQPELRAGDIIVAMNLGGQIIDVEKFQNAVRETTAGTTVRASVWRFNPATGGFDERESTLKTFPYPNQKGSRLGLVGEPGFVVTSIDPSVEQPELRVGDVIVATSVGGQLTNGEQFQAAVRGLGAGSELRASVLRFNPATGTYEERQVALKTSP